MKTKLITDLQQNTEGNSQNEIKISLHLSYSLRIPLGYYFPIKY